MVDKNGIELKTGQIVKIEGGYFKSDNGFFIVKHSPNDMNWNGSDYCLHKCSKKGIESKSKYNVSFFPLMVTVSNRDTRILAREHNKNNATIEVVGAVNTYKIDLLENIRYRAESYTRIVTEEEYQELLAIDGDRIELLKVEKL